MKYCYSVDVSKLNLPAADQKRYETSGQNSLFEGFITTLFGVKYPEGMKGVTVRCLDAIFAKLDEAADGHLELDDKETALLAEVFTSDIALHPAQVRYHSMLRRNFEKAQGA